MDDPVFVGIDDGLDAVAQPKFAEHPDEVCRHDGIG
jgi:hypothetical protein